MDPQNAQHRPSPLPGVSETEPPPSVRAAADASELIQSSARPAAPIAAVVATVIGLGAIGLKYARTRARRDG